MVVSDPSAFAAATSSSIDCAEAIDTVIASRLALAASIFIVVI
jgi:hypothetical protein